ncbi:MAG TPA: sigma-54 dependent transcriptional regulator [bacterium]|nr:sigma-54 dependent transcriptional regulator [bacterium]
MKRTVLIADDEILKLMTLKSRLNKAGLNVITATDGQTALDMLASQEVHAIVTDVRMPGVSGLTLLEKSKELDPSRPVLVMTGYGAVEDAVRAMRAGAEDYMMKPVSAEEILVRLERAFALSRMSHDYQRLRDEMERLSGPREPVAASEKMRAVLEKFRRAAETEATVLVVGETGTGKEVCARFLHSRSRRAAGPFVAVSCAALAPGVVESELFGHEKGSFTGAGARREGRLYAAAGGTLFLDDVDDIPLEVQAKLLRVLEDSTYERVGGSERIKADVRFVAATKKNLEELVALGRFRDDLMYRLKVVQIEIPPLRERRDEIAVLAEYFLKRSVARMGRPPKQFTPAALTAMKNFIWPGNIRELEHMVDSLVAIHPGEQIRVEDLPERLKITGQNPLFTLNLSGKESINLDDALAEFEKRLLAWALDKSQGNQGKAAQLLSIPRSTFQYRWSKLKDQSE